MSLPTNPINRKEAYLNAIATGNTVDMPAKPITREEAYLDAIAKNGGGSGGAENYAQLSGKPQINNVELESGNNSLSALGIASASAVDGIKDGQSINSFSAVENALAGKVDKVEGKGLSTNDYDDTEKGKVADNTSAIEAMNENGCCNILPNNATSTILNGITWTVNSDGTVTASGTAGSDGSNFAIFDYGGGSPFPAIGNKIYKSPAGASDSTYYILVLETPGNNWVKIYDEDYECNSNLRFINLSIAPNYAIQGSITFEPMIYDKRLTLTGYVPYSMTNRELTERVDRGSVSVTADGVKTYNQLLNSLYTLIDTSKISFQSVLVLNDLDVFTLIYFGGIGIMYSAATFGASGGTLYPVVNRYRIHSKDSSYMISDNTGGSDLSNSIPSAGTIFTVNY